MTGTSFAAYKSSLRDMLGKPMETIVQSGERALQIAEPTTEIRDEMPILNATVNTDLLTEDPRSRHLTDNPAIINPRKSVILEHGNEFRIQFQCVSTIAAFQYYPIKLIHPSAVIAYSKPICLIEDWQKSSYKKWIGMRAEMDQNAIGILNHIGLRINYGP